MPRLSTYHVLATTLSQKFNLDRASQASREPIELRFIDGYTKRVSPLKIVLPIAASDRREGELKIDGSLSDWGQSDAIQDGRLVKMFDRSCVQRQELQFASTSASQIFTCSGAENFYIAFLLTGISHPKNFTQNFVNYDGRRAWGEDLCEILIQPILPDNSLGNVLHVVCKPQGGIWIERKLAGVTGKNDSTWQPLESAGIRYGATTDSAQWRGELAIPWVALLGPNADPSTLIRFNFSQHQQSTGESTSWAGPTDFGRDNAMMGLIRLRSATK